jgi:hypothetical protein
MGISDASYFMYIEKKKNKGGLMDGDIHGLVVKANRSQSRGHGFEPGTVYWTDVSKACYNIQENKGN